MASEFLKQKAAKQQNKATEEMVPDVAGSTAKASAFLRQKAQQQAQSDPSIKRTAGKASAFLQQKAKQQEQRMPKRNTRNVGGGEVGAVRSAPSAWQQEETQVQGLTTQQRYEAAQKAYDAYVNSDEYRANQLQKMVNQSIEATKASGISTPYAAALQQHTSPEVDEKEKELRAARDYYKQLYDAEESQKIMDADLAELGKWAEKDRAALETYVNFRQNSVTSGGYAVPAKRAYSMLVKKYGKEKVNNLAESWQRNQNAKATQDLMQSSEEAVKGKTGASILHSAATVPANLLGSVTGVYGTMLDLATRTGRYPTLDPNNVGNMANVYSGAVRTQVAENIAGDEYDEQGNKVSDGGAVRQALSYGYQGLMASADSLARAALGGGDKVISLGLAATGSFGQTVSEASERGATPEQAIALGVINGGLEVATEYLPLDEILKVAEGGPVSAKKLFSNIAKQAGIEVIEEEASFFGSVMAEAAVLQEKSGYRQKIAEAVAGGATYEDAMERANWELVWEAAETAFTSAFSGGISGGVSSGAANMNHFLQQKTQGQKPTNPDAHVELADMQVEFQKETWDMCDRLAKATGRNIKLYQHYGPGSSAENGYFENGVIYVNTKSGDPVAQIVSHELTHSVEFAQEYQELSRMVLGRIEALGGDLKQLRQQKADLYAQEGHPLGSQAEVDQEIVAEYVAKNLLTNEQQIMEVAQQNRTLIEKIKAWVDKLLAAIGNKDAAERAYLTNVQNLYAKALQQTPHNAQQTAVQNAPTAVQTQEETAALDDSEKLDWNDPVQIRTWAQNMLSSGQITSEEFNGYIDLAEQIAEENAGRETFTEKKHSISSNRKYSFAGPNAKTANSQTLAEAKTLDEQGAANEAIRQQTGWFKGMDGKWRFEVDDSTSRVNENVSNYMTLGELLQDAEIFEAYPDMKDIGVVFQSLPSGVYAQYNRQFDQIDVSYELKGVPEAIRDAVLHEIQHAIQNREGFTVGATVDSWNRKIKAGFDSRRGADIRKARETEMEIRRVQQEEPEFYRDMMDLNAMLPDMPRGEVDWDTLEEITEDPPEWQAFDARREELQELYGDMKVWDFMDLLYQQEKAAKNEGRSATELYWDTAGEIEARNVADRRNLTAEERKNTPPRLGDEDTVLAENSGWASAAYDPETASIKEQLANNQNELQNMEPVAKVTVPENLKDKRTAYSWAVELLKPTGYRVERQGFGTIWFEKDDINYGLNYADTPEEKAALALLPRILKRGVEIGRHGNHKQRQKETVTFAAPAEVNGTRVNMAAVVTVRNGRYYTHRIVLPDGTVFKFGAEKNNDAVREPHRGVPTKGSLANATSTASINIVDDNAPNVKQQMSISPTVSRKNVANDLRGILSRGGDVTELRKYISQLEQGSGNAERSGRNAYQNGAGAEQSEAQRIISMAKRYGISVEEYLRRNWEQYDVDGQWNSDARKALELERQGRKYSVSETDEQTEQKTAEQIRQEMPAKARNYLQGAERKLLTELQNKLGVNKFTNRDDLKAIVEEIADEYLTTGAVAQDKVDFLFDKAYAGGIVRDAEFYEQYKEIKNHLRNTAVTISEGDSHDIADFQDFRRRNWGELRIVKEGGLPVDSAYHELNEMAPELFPESITHPADQLVRMAEVSRSIQVVETNLNAYHGDDRENFRSWARNDFESAVAEVLGDFRQVKRYIEGKADEQEAAPTTPEEAAQYYKQLKDARRTYERAQAKNLLTPHDEIQLGKLLRGETTPEALNPETDYVKGILAVYEGKKEYERLCKLLAEYKRAVRGGYREKADEYLETANAWKDKKVGIAYSRETMERNIDDIVPDKEVAKAIKREYFEAVHVSEAEATRFKTELRNRVRGLNLSTKIKKGNLVSEAHAVQLLGEAEDNIRVLQKARGRMKMRDGKTLEEWRSVIAELWHENPGLDQGKIRSAVEEFRTIYDELFEKMNAVRIRNGYEPVNYRQGYFPHFQPGEGDGFLGAFGKALNIDTQVAALPTTINGLTHTFKPGIQWFGNAQERLGFNTAYDAVEGFDKYIEGVASVIYQTENIQKLRALATQIRYRTSEEGIRRQVDEIRARDNLSEEEKQVQINSIFEHGKYTLSNFVNELDEYTNLLANKKSKLDRTMEAMMGRKAYTVMKAWEARVGANMIAGNLSSAMTNFIPLTQAGAQLDATSMLKGMRDTLVINLGSWLDKKSLLKGMAATLKSYKDDDGIAGISTFLTNRRGSDPLVQTWVQKASKVMGTPMELIDGFTADSIVRAAYFQNLKRGLSEAEAMHQADVFASHVMADRSKGAMPTLFESKNPVFKGFTQFQLEVNNQFSEVFKDLPRGHREKGFAALTLVLLKYFLGAFLYNEVYEYFVGRRPALDPFGIMNDTVGDLTGYELPNLVEWSADAIQDKETSFQTEKVGVGKAGTNLAGTLMGELPFSSGLTLLGIETDGGRIPASSAVPDLTALWKAATEEEWSTEKRWKEIQDELDKAAYVVPPFMGNQIGKAWNGIKTYIQGGSYSVDAEGNDILQYPVYKDGGAKEKGRAIKMAVLGKSSIKEAQDWIESGFKSLSAKQTAAYQDMLKAGENDRKAYALLQKLQTVEKTEDASKKLNQLEILEDADVSRESKAIVYYGLMASESEQELMDSLADAGAEQSEIGKLMMDLYQADQMKGNKKREAQRKAIAGVPMTEKEKKLVVGSILGTEMLTEKGKPTQYANFLSATNRGLSVDDFMEMRSKGVDVEEYLECTDAGIGSKVALELAYDMHELEEQDDVEAAEYWRLAVKSSDNEAAQLSLLAGRMEKSTFKKLRIAYDLDVSPDMFVTYYEKQNEFDSDGNGSYTQAEVKAVIDAIGRGYTNEQKGVLWQMGTGSKSTKNNPYSKEAGQKWIDAKNADKENE